MLRKAILCHTTGVNHIDLEICKKRGIKVFNSAGSAAEAVSEHAIILVCSSYTKLYIAV